MTQRTPQEREPLWQPCSPGTFAHLAGQLGRHRRRRTFLRLAVTASILAATGGALAFWLHSPTEIEYHFAGLSCSTVQGLGMAGMEKMSPVQMEQVRRHVSQCPRCGPLFRAMGITM